MVLPQGNAKLRFFSLRYLRNDEALIEGIAQANRMKVILMTESTLCAVPWMLHPEAREGSRFDGKTIRRSRI